MWERFAPRLRRLVLAALDAGGRDGREEATAVDLLAAVLRDRESAAVFLVEHGGSSAERLAKRVAPEPLRRASPNAGRAERFSGDALLALDVAAAESAKRGDEHVGTEHLLLALLQLGRGNGNPTPKLVLEPIDVALRGERLTYDGALEALDAWHARGMPRRRPHVPGGGPMALLPAWLARGAYRFAARATRWPRIGYRVFVRLSLGHPGYVSNPYPLYAKLRRREPVRLDPLLKVWVLTRYADVNALLRDPRFRRDPYAMDLLPETAREQLNGRGKTGPGSSPASSGNGEGMGGLLGSQMLFIDPPRHTRIRSLFTKAFTPASLAALRPRIELIANKRIDRVIASGRMDVIRDLAYPLPTIVIAELLGFPPEDYEKLKRWSDDFAGQLSLNPADADTSTINQSIAEMEAYFETVVADLKRHPRDNLLNRLLAVEAEGDRLSRGELFANTVLLLAAGHETVTNMIGNGMLQLLRHPEQLQLLRDDPSLAPSAADELLRFDSPVQWLARVAGEDVEIGGRQIRRGQMVVASLGAANRDPAQFPDADRLDLRRSENRHLAFGSGIHFCLGATLARMEGEIALRLLATRLRHPRLAARRFQRHRGLTFRGVTSLPITFDADAASAASGSAA